MTMRHGDDYQYQYENHYKMSILLQLAMAEDTTLHTEGERTYIANPRRLLQSGEEAHKYRLKVLIFGHRKCQTVYLRIQ